MADDPDRSFAALTRYDVLLVNPVRDGLNLVAKEGPLVNTADGVLALSREAGAFDELGGTALEINPFDVADTADVLAAALAMGPGERARRAAEAAGDRGQRTPGTGWPTCWERRKVERGLRGGPVSPQRRSPLRRPPGGRAAPGLASGPVTTMSAAATSAGGIRRRPPPCAPSSGRLGQRSRAAKAARSPASSPA